MSESSVMTETVSTIYLVCCFAIPVLYLILYSFLTKKSKKKNFAKALGIAICLMIILFSVKLVLRLNIAIFDYPNCYINNICSNDVDDENETPKKNNKDKTSATNSTSSTNTTSSTTPKKVNPNAKVYDNVKENRGTKTDKGRTAKGYEIYEIDGVTYVDGFLIANKTYFLPESYAPTNTYNKANPKATQTCNNCIEKEVWDAYQDMKADATAVGLNIYISSGFRSYVVQNTLYNRYVEREGGGETGKAKADRYSARPGSSEHQTGLCYDLNTIDDSFANTAEGKWVNQNAHKYGFIIRYPKGKESETGYMYESWHLRYVGTELAEKLYNDGNWISMEEYFGITSKYEE